MPPQLNLIPRRSFTYVLTQQGLDRLEKAVQKKWENHPTRTTDRNGKLRANPKKLSSVDRAGLLDLDRKTADSIYRREPHTVSALKAAFKAVNTSPPFSVEKDCIAVPSMHSSTPFLGRENDVAQIAALLQSHCLVTLTGAGGIGKTRLAKEAAEVLKRHYRAGIWFVDLARIEDESLVVPTVAATLGIQEATDRPILQAISDFLAQKPLLLILDNCEHLRSTCCVLANHLLSASAELRILATSRARLCSRSEKLYPVPSLSLPDLQRLKDADEGRVSLALEAESIRLFVMCARRLRPDFAVTQENAVQMGDICRRLGGIPLAIELAAGRTLAKTLPQIKQGLNDCFRLLIGREEAELPRHQTLRATLDWSYHLLTQKEQTLLQRLAVFAGGCSSNSAEQVCADDALDKKAIEDGLEALVENSLVAYQERAGEERYLLLESVHQYGRERLTETENAAEAAVKQRYRDYFLALVEAANMHLNGKEENTWLQRLDAEQENLRTALNGYLEAGEIQIAQQFCAALDRFWQLRGYITEGRMWCTRVLKAAGGQERTVQRAEVLRCAGHLAGRQCDTALAETLCKESLTIWQEQKDERGIAIAYLSLGTVISGSRRCEEARNLMEASLATFRMLGDSKRIVWALYNLAMVAREQGDCLRVSQLLKESLDIRRDLGDRRGIALSLYALGENARNQGDYATAKRYCTESLSTFRELGDRPGLAATLNLQGDLLMIQGDYGAATKPYQESLALYKELAFPHNVAWMLRNMGNLAFAECRYDQAYDAFSQALTAFPPNNELGVALARIGLGYVVREQGDWQKARELLEQSAADLQTLEGRSCPVFLLNSLGIVDMEQGHLLAAQTRFDEALTLSEKSGAKMGIAESLYNQGLVAMERGDYGTAKVHFEEALTRFRTANTKQKMAHTFRVLGLVSCKQGNLASAEDWHRRSLQLFRTLRNHKDIAQSLEAFADLSAAESLWERAAQLWGAADRIREDLGAPPAPSEQKAQAYAVAEARKRAGRAAFVIAWEHGGSLSLEQAITLALEPAPMRPLFPLPGTV